MKNPALHLLEIDIAPKSSEDYQILFAALQDLAADDKSFTYAIDPEMRRFTLEGMDQILLDIKVDMLKRICKADANFSGPQVAYRERLTKKVDIDYTHKKLTGGAVQFARVVITFEPNDPDAGNAFESKIVGGSVPEEYIRGIENGIDSVIGSGILAGFPVVDVKATLTDVGFDDADSSALAFEIAARAAFREALQKGGSVLLEPIMKVEVVTPEEYAGSVIGDLNSRSGHIRGQDMRGDVVVVDAVAPLANMLGYVNQLRAFTQGRADCAMQYSHYAPLPERHGPDGRFPSAVGLRLKARLA